MLKIKKQTKKYMIITDLFLIYAKTIHRLGVFDVIKNLSVKHTIRYH